MKLSTPSGISADIKWDSMDVKDKGQDISVGGSAMLTDGQDVNLPVDFSIKKFYHDGSRDSTTQNLIDIWRLDGDRNITPTIAELKNGDYVVSGLDNGIDMLRTIRTFDFNHDGQLDCYLLFLGYNSQDVYQYFLNNFATSANVMPYSVVTWNPYVASIVGE